MLRAIEFLHLRGTRSLTLLFSGNIGESPPTVANGCRPGIASRCDVGNDHGRCVSGEGGVEPAFSARLRCCMVEPSVGVLMQRIALVGQRRRSLVLRGPRCDGK